MKRIVMAALAAGVCLNSVQAYAAEQSSKKWMVRVRAVDVAPDESSTISPIGGSAEIDNTIVPEVDFTYFFTKNIAAELILATTKHNVLAKGTSLGDVDAGNAWLLPPTLTLQYHFDQLDFVKPYVGVGVNYTMFYNADSGALANVDYDNSFGLAYQAGIDVPIGGDWYFNADVKKVMINTKAKFNNGGVVADVDIDPVLFGIGIGYRF